MKKISERDRILLMFIERCSDEYNEVDPELVLEEAKRLIEKMHSQTKPSMKAWDYINEAFETIKQKEQRDYGRRTPAYQVAAVMYVLLCLKKFDSIEDWRDEYLATNLARAIFSRQNFNCTLEEADRVVCEIHTFHNPELESTESPVTPTSPLEIKHPAQIEEAIAKINSQELRPNQVDWELMLNQMLVAVRLIPQKAKPLMWLQYFTTGVEVYDYRIEMLQKLKDVAPKCFTTSQETNDFKSDCDCLIYLTRRLKVLTLQGKQIENLWNENPVFNELAVIFKDITIEEMVALSQAMLVRKREHINVFEFVFRLSEYIGKMYDCGITRFCQGLFSAESIRQYIMKGEAFAIKIRNNDADIVESFPTIKTLPIRLRNACFDEYIALRLKQIRAELEEDNDRLYPADDKECLQKLLEREKLNVEEFEFGMTFDFPGYKDVLKMAKYFLKYLGDKIEKESQPNQITTNKIYNISGDFIQEKHVDDEINVAPGGIGINNNKQ